MAAASGVLCTIPAWRPFADDLAAGLLAEYPQPLALSRLLLLLPTRRSIRALTEAFLRESAGRALLLPRMVAAGDLDAEEALSADEPLFAALSGEAEALPLLSPRGKRLALARLLAAAGRPATEALALGGRLGDALDTLEIEGKGAADVTAAVPAGELQLHWQKNAEILALVQRQWPGVLRQRGRIDPARRRNLALRALARRWRAAPPAGPVLMAGFAAAPPAVAELAHVVVRLPGSRLLLPGLDLAMPAAARAALAADRDGRSLETHPQHGMAALLEAAGLAVGEARPWPHRSERQGGPEARAALVNRALLPPGFDMRGGAPAETAGLRMVEAANPAEEALLVALAMRQIVERPGLTAALVTSDRTLARRVAVQLARFGIAVDDSAGRPLAATGPGSLLVALATAAAERFAPVALLALLQHPLVRPGEARVAWLSRVRALDLQALRGVRPPPGLAGVERRLGRAKVATAALRDWWTDEVVPLLAPLEPLPERADLLLDRLREVAGRLAGEPLWAGDAGRALAALFSSLEECRADLAGLPVAPGEAGAFVAALLAGETVRPRYSLHPQLHIWGPLEARLQTADLLILGGLNEGVSPSAPAPDPFLAPAIRRALRLPGLARRIGLQAQDFAAAVAGAPEVLLTRSLRAGGAPTIPSRFWQRLLAAAGRLADSGRLLPAGAALLAATRALDRPDALPPFARPAPAPPAAARPKRIGVTEVAMLRADPFSFYARRVLGLAPQRPRDADPTAGDLGEAMHNVLKRLLDEGLPGMERLAALVDDELRKLGDRPELAALWRPRALRMVGWAAERLRQAEGWAPVVWEQEGRLDVGGVELVGRIDRLDRLGERLRVVDYKTGNLPQVAEVESCCQTQLALLATLAEAGRFGAFGAARVAELCYWKLSGGSEPGEIRAALGSKAAEADVVAHIEAAFAEFRDLVAGYLVGRRPFEAKAHMVYGRRYRDYDHLARMAEWPGR